MKDNFDNLEAVALEVVCPIRYVLSFIGQKWKIPILWHLAEESPLRYNELKRDVFGITNIMLTQSLRELEAHELVLRVQHDTVPPMVEYSLTERGKTLIPILQSLHEWGKQQLELDVEKRRNMPQPQ